MSESSEQGEPQPDAVAAPARKKWVRAAADRLPTKWIAGVGTVLFLLATAAFGGLQAVAETPLSEITAGETYAGDHMTFTPIEVYLSDITRGTGLSLGADEDDDEERTLLVLLVEAMNTDIEPRAAFSASAVSAVRAKALTDAAPSLRRTDDGHREPWLQPRVPARLTLAWVVPVSEVRPGAEVRFTLPESSKHTGSFVISGTYWDDVRPGAEAVLRIDRHEREEIG